MGEIGVSIVIPVYNVEKYLEQCLDSVLKQNMLNIEVICVNDGSTDNSGDILERYKKNDSRIKVISQENEGLSSARNTGINHATYEYILFLDSDDMLCENALLTIIESLSQTKVDVLFYDAMCIYETKELELTRNKDAYYMRKKVYKGPVKLRTMFCDMVENDDFVIAAWNFCIKREWLENNELYFEKGRIYEDFPFLLKMFFLDGLSSHINQQLIKYRVRAGSIMNSKIKAENMISYIFTVRDMVDLLLEKKITEQESLAVKNLGKAIVNTVRQADKGLAIEERIKMEDLDEISMLISENLQIGIYGVQHFSIDLYKCGFDDKLHNSEYIIIYGAGDIGVRTYNYIKKMGYESKIVCFAVTKDADDNIDGVVINNIHSIDERYKEKALVIVAACDKYSDDMYNTAQKVGFMDILKMDLKLEEIISN